MHFLTPTEKDALRRDWLRVYQDRRSMSREVEAAASGLLGHPLDSAERGIVSHCSRGGVPWDGACKVLAVYAEHGTAAALDALSAVLPPGGPAATRASVAAVLAEVYERDLAGRPATRRYLDAAGQVAELALTSRFGPGRWRVQWPAVDDRAGAVVVCPHGTIASYGLAEDEDERPDVFCELCGGLR